jgi:RNA polymerase sigma-70 factor (ECF subfamily)
LQHKRKNDPLRGANEHEDADSSREDSTSVALDLDRALATLSPDVRLCIVLSYHERMTHPEIAAFTRQPLGTVKSHIRRGTKKLQEELAAYVEPEKEMK